MTDETLHCGDCGEQVRVEKRDLVGLVLTCGCDKTFSIKVAIKIPDGWNA